MSTLTDIVKVTTLLSGPTPSQAGFGLILLACYHTATPNMYDTYASLDEVAADHQVTSAPYKMASRVFSQNPAPPEVAIGKRLTAFTKSVDLSPVNTNVGFGYAFDIFGVDGTKTSVSYVVQLGDTLDDIVDGLVADIGSPNGVTVTGHHATSTPLTKAKVIGTVDLLTLDPSTLNTQTFIVTTNLGGPYTTTFTGVATLDDIVDQINAITTTNGTASLDFSTEGEVHLAFESFTTGTTGTISVGNGTADNDLGFTNGQTATGTNAPAGGARVNLSATVAGTLFDLVDLPKPWDLKVADITADPGIEADIQAIADDNSEWYGLALDSSSEAEAEGVADWVEANKKLFANTTCDSACGDPNVTTDVMSDLAALGYMRTYTAYLGNQLNSYLALGLMANRFPLDPGVPTWQYVTVIGVKPDTLKSAFAHAIAGVPDQGTHGKRGLIYVKAAGLSVVINTVTAGEEWIDVIHGRDWLDARLAEAIFGAKKAATDRGSKIPYTTDGINILVGVAKSVLILAQKKGFLADFTGPDAPAIGDISASDKHNRLLEPVKWGAKLAGAIHATQITGVLTE